MDRASHSLNPEDLLQHVSWVRALAVALVGENRADDLTQQTMLRAIERPPQHQSNLRGWLGAVARNFAFNSTRRHARRRELLEEKGLTRNPEAAAQKGDVGLPPAPEDLLGRSEAHNQLISTLKELPDPGRHLLLLRFFEDLTPTEIATRHKLPASTVRVQISRALKDLRRLMQSRYGGDGMAPCLAILAPTLGSQLVPAGPIAVKSGLSLKPAAMAIGGIGLAVGAGLYLWGLPDAPLEGLPEDPPAAFAREKSESDFATAMVVGSEGASGIFSRQAVAQNGLLLTVVDENGVALPGARVRAHADGTSLGFATTGSAGEVRLPPTGATVLLQISAAGHAPRLTRVLLEDGATEVRLPAGLPFAGSTQALGAGSDHPLGDGAADAGAPPTMLRLESDQPLYREGTPEFPWLDELEAKYASYRNFLVPLAKDGTFLFYGLPAGWSGHIASADPRWRLDDAGLDREADGRQRLDRPTQGLSLRLLPTPRYRGQVHWPKALEDAVLTIRLGGHQSTQPLAADGHFEILADPAQQRPLQILVDAADGVHGDFRWNTAPRDGRLGALEVESSQLLRFLVRSEAGHPIADALVLPLALDSPGFHSDADGRVRLLADAGTAASGLLVRAPGFLPRRISASHSVEVVLHKAPRFALNLVDAAGDVPPQVEAFTIRLRNEQGLFSGSTSLDRGFLPLTGTLFASGIHTENGLMHLDLGPDAAGMIEVAGLDAGTTVALEVIAPGGRVVVRRDFIAPSGFESEAMQLTIEALPRALRLRVLDPDGFSIADARVTLRAPHSEAALLQGRSDLQGNVQFPALYLDSAQLRVQADGFLPWAHEQVDLATWNGRDVVLQRAREVRVHVYDADGNALATLPLGGLPLDDADYRVHFDSWEFGGSVAAGLLDVDLHLPRRTTVLLNATELAQAVARHLGDPQRTPRSGQPSHGSMWLRLTGGDGRTRDYPLLPGLGLATPIQVPSGLGRARLYLRSAAAGAEAQLLVDQEIVLQPGAEHSLDLRGD